MPQRPLPSAADIYQQLHRITPSLSSHDEDEEEYEGGMEQEPVQRSRMELSPSPEVDLSSPELDDNDESAPASPSRSFLSHLSASQDRRPSQKNLLHNRRACSPQLEPEERTFKQTANQLLEQEQQRQNSLKDVDMEQDSKEGASEEIESIAVSVEPQDEESAARKNREVAAELFAHAEHLHVATSSIEFSSPMMMPQASLAANPVHTHSKLSRHDEVMEHMSLDLDTKDIGLENFSWDSLQSPENIELEELDVMFDAY